MAKASVRRSMIETSPSGTGEVDEDINLAINSLIDDLIVPYLVEEFLRLYGPAAVSKTNGENMKSQLDSELPSMP
jgi:hypothetical protein